MRVLLIAYEYPPVIAAQSLRWFYLANELASLGIEVEILTTKIRDIWSFSGRIAPSIVVHRCFPGPFVGLSGWGADKLGQSTNGSGTPRSVTPEARPSAIKPTRALGHLYTGLRRFLNHVLFPDVRTEWLPFAWVTLKRLCNARRYDLMISSHEPGVDLMLGLFARARWRTPWIVDLGDPLLAPYTPRWRKRLDRRFERTVCTKADHILVTTDVLSKLLSVRHDIPQERFTVIPQGFDATGAILRSSHQESMRDGANRREEDAFTLIYTGTFYRGFRDPSELLAAVAATPGVHLIIAGEAADFGPQLEGLGERVKTLGKIDHVVCLELQKQATVLVSLGNRQTYQVPGKLFEYFGACRPILHISSSVESDPVAQLLRPLRRGVVARNNEADIRKALERLARFWRQGKLNGEFDLSLERVEKYSWKASATWLRAVCNEVEAPPPASPQEICTA